MFVLRVCIRLCGIGSGYVSLLEMVRLPLAKFPDRAGILTDLDVFVPDEDPDSESPRCLWKISWITPLAWDPVLLVSDTLGNEALLPLSFLGRLSP